MTRLTRIADRIKSRFDRSDWRGLAKDLLIPALFVMVVAAPSRADAVREVQDESAELAWDEMIACGIIKA